MTATRPNACNTLANDGLRDRPLEPGERKVDVDGRMVRPGLITSTRDPWFVPAGPSQTVRVIRHTYDAFEVEAFGLHGERLAHRMYTIGRHRRAWAIEQARQWADRYYLYFDERTHD